MRKDFAELFAAEGEVAKERLEELKAQAVDALDLTLFEAPEGSMRERYRYAKEGVLPLVAKLEDPGEKEAALKDATNALKLKPAHHLRKALAEAGSEEGAHLASADTSDPAKPPAADTERYERAMDLLKRPDLLDEMVKDLESLGHVGERKTKKLAFLCGLSARSGKPIQPSTHAQSSAGKNALWDSTLSLFPEEMVVRRSGITAKALFRTEANLMGSVLYLQEVAGSEDASYTIRVMQSDGRLEYEATEKMPDGGMKNVVYQTEGPTVIVQTTTKNHLHPENETRVLPIYIDESEAQTGRIVERIKQEAAGIGLISPRERERILEKWHDAIRILEPGEVLIPYAERIEIPSSPIRIRRDARRLLDVVRVRSWLYQHQRDRDAQGRILATEEDFYAALSLISESLTRAWQTLTPAEEAVLRVIVALPEGKRKSGFKRRDLKVPTVSDRRVKEVLSSLTDTGYLDCDGRKGPQGYSYTVARDAEKISLGIYLRPSPDSQETPANSGDSTGREAFARYRPVPGSEEEENGHRASGDTGRNDRRPIKPADLQEELAIGRSGDEDGEEESVDERNAGGDDPPANAYDRMVEDRMASLNAVLPDDRRNHPLDCECDECA